ncbi:hypothetical protein PDESU_04536 [Pontiella desulfatans]|uniref:Beta-barrel assembly-enhancing protease n=2 Tax=Pontiella desulfatans TaxID=2750659 RepID=A0A6C2U898_PONDE|nr:hypothetical protein PDESU_04536 [Pontiella desulfatans]
MAAVATGAALLSHKPSEGNNMAKGSVYLLGPARALLAESLYERADLYFHKGVGHEKEEAFHGFFQKWKEEIVPNKHAHTEGREIEEILPWLRLASKSDPHNIEIYLVASFWLNGECDRPELARDAIREAMEKNPDRYELPLEMGRLFLSSAEYAPALESLETAMEMLTSIEEQADPEQAALDLAFIHISRSFVNEAMDKQEEAIVAAKDRLQLSPSPVFAERLAKLEAGELDPEAAKARLELLFHKTHECEDDDHDHDHEHGEECDCGHDDHEEHVHGPDCNH